MKLTIERAALLQTMSQVQSVVEKRNTIPILANVLIRAEGDDVTFQASDLDIEITDKASAQIEKDGAITVSSATLHEIVRKLPENAPINMESEENSGILKITAARSKFSLNTLPAEDFPIMADSEYQKTFSLSAPVLRRLFEKTAFAISNEEARYYLNGVYMHVTDDEEKKKKSLRCVSTDGHRLALIDIDLPEGIEDIPSVIIPRKTVDRMRKIQGDDDVNIIISISEDKIRFETGKMILVSKVIDGTFPDYNRVIPLQNQKVMGVDAGDLSRAVDRVSTVASDRTRAVQMNIHEDRLTLSMVSTDSGAANEEVHVAYNEELLQIGFNARYVADIIGQVETENASFAFNTASDPALIREEGDDSILYVIMPMRT